MVFWNYYYTLSSEIYLKAQSIRDTYILRLWRGSSSNYKRKLITNSFGYLFIGMPVETSISISAASQAHHDGLCQQLVQRYRGIVGYEGEEGRERVSTSTEKPRTVLNIPSRITVRGSSNRRAKREEEVANGRRWQDHITAGITTRHWRY